MAATAQTPTGLDQWSEEDDEDTDEAEETNEQAAPDPARAAFARWRFALVDGAVALSLAQFFGARFHQVYMMFFRTTRTFDREFSEALLTGLIGFLFIYLWWLEGSSHEHERRNGWRLAFFVVLVSGNLASGGFDADWLGGPGQQIFGATLAFKFWMYVSALCRGLPRQKSLSLHSLLRCAMFTPLFTAGIAYGALTEANLRVFSQHQDVLMVGVFLALVIWYKTLKVLYYNSTAPGPSESFASRALDLFLLLVLTPLGAALLIGILEGAGLAKSTFEIAACATLPITYAVGLIGLAFVNVLNSGMSSTPAPQGQPG